MDRRKFLRLAALAGGLGLAPSLLRSALGSSSPAGLPPKPRPPPQIPEEIPPVIADPVLRVAQWYDYWPGSVLANFQSYVASTYGVTVTVAQDIYTSNEELYAWMTQAGRRYDVVFPTQHAAERMWREGLLRPIEPALVPNLSNLFPEYVSPAWALDRKGNRFAAPYQAGTTGVAFRTDKGWTTADVEGLGWDLLWTDLLGGTSLVDKAMALADLRDLLGMGLKKEGFDATGTALVSEGQWSLSTADLGQLGAARDSLLARKPSWFTIESVNAGPFLANEIVYAAEIWSGAALYAIRPYTTSPQPIDFVHPKQGFPRWVDSACIPATTGNAFLAHVFVNYLLDAAVGARITDWNLHATPNAAAYDLLTAYPNGWDPRLDSRIYPDATTLARGEFARSLPSEVETAYLQAYNDVVYG